MSLARRISVELAINGKDITRDISDCVTQVSVSDALDGETNSADISLEDREHLWLKDWFPQRGDNVKLGFTRTNWRGNDEVEHFDFDFWEIDEITNAFPPSTAKIKLNSVSSASELKSCDKSRSWENVKLRKICADVAAEAGLTLFYSASTDPDIERAERKSESNLSFLHSLAKKHGLILRVSENQLIICDEEQLESAEPITTFSTDTVISFSGRATLSEIYSSAEVDYSHGKQKTKIHGEFKDDSKPGGKTLKIKKKVSSQAEADDLAKKELRDKNKKEISVQLDVMGEFDYLAGSVIELDDSFGFYKGNYIIERADWRVGGGFTCKLDLRKCLSGY